VHTLLLTHSAPEFATPTLWRDTEHVLELTEAEFEGLVSDALDRIPAELATVMDNVVILVEDEPSADTPGLLGLYEGTPLTERGGWYSGVLPDTIRLFRLPILRMCQTRDDAVEEVLVTVVHEIAHHFGIDDDKLAELGWG
jgi:predicted Zn-dependent protease with MMP-like domain